MLRQFSMKPGFVPLAENCTGKHIHIVIAIPGAKKWIQLVHGHAV